MQADRFERALRVKRDYTDRLVFATDSLKRQSDEAKRVEMVLRDKDCAPSRVQSKPVPLSSTQRRPGVCSLWRTQSCALATTSTHWHACQTAHVLCPQSASVPICWTARVGADDKKPVSFLDCLPSEQYQCTVCERQNNVRILRIFGPIDQSVNECSKFKYSHI